MNDDQRKQLVSVYQRGLLEDTLPFWTNYAVDQQHGGFITSLDRNGSVVDTDKGVWQQGRFTWLLGEVFNNVEPRQEWLKLAKHGIDFLEKHCFDSSDGRMWFQLNREGEPIRKRRYSFSESFAAIAYGEYAQATGNQLYVEKAKSLFHQFIQHSLDPVGVEPKFTGTRPMRGIGVPMIAIVTAQELRDSIGLEDADEWIDRFIKEIRDLFVKPEIECVMESVGSEGEIIDSYEGRTLNPGHAIECASFIVREGKYRNDAELLALGCQMLDWTWARGWDPKFGGLFYFVDVYDRPVQEYWHDMKFWWPHTEAITATLLAWSQTGQEQYLAWHQEVHDWAYSHFSDPGSGEWFGYLCRDGSISSTAKGNLWKGPFHIPRMQLNCSKILSDMAGGHASQAH